VRIDDYDVSVGGGGVSFYTDYDFLTKFLLCNLQTREEIERQF
jgi:hypothetical protein